MKSCTPRMAKHRKTKSSSEPTCTSLGVASISACTIARVAPNEGTDFIARSSRAARRAERPERLMHSTGRSPSNETIETNPSIQFHPSRRYAPGCCHRPNNKSFNSISEI